MRKSDNVTISDHFLVLWPLLIIISCSSDQHVGKLDKMTIFSFCCNIIFHPSDLYVVKNLSPLCGKKIIKLRGTMTMHFGNIANLEWKLILQYDHFLMMVKQNITIWSYFYAATPFWTLIRQFLCLYQKRLISCPYMVKNH